LGAGHVKSVNPQQKCHLEWASSCFVEAPRSLFRAAASCPRSSPLRVRWWLCAPGGIAAKRRVIAIEDARANVPADLFDAPSAHAAEPGG
jgi:hypothetical protein